MSDAILIVDDEAELTRLLGEYFRIKKGYRVFAAIDGQKALDIIKKEEPALVLLDMKLPSVNGLEILKLLRSKRYRHTRVIVMTAYDSEYKKKIDSLGYDKFFIKPILFEELKAAVEGLLTGTEQEKPRQIIPDGCLPQARLAVIEIRSSVAKLIKDYLENIPETGRYNVMCINSPALHFAELSEFAPDLVLYDILEIGGFGDFAQRLMQLPNPPKEIILFGDPQFKWQEVEMLTRKGMSYVPTRNNAEFELPSRDTVERLAKLIKETCFKYGLVTKKGGV